MTVHLSIPSSSRLPTPLSAEEEANNEAGLRAVSVAIRSASRIVVLSGAGISVEAGVPDFRSSTGLFHSLGASSSEESRKAGVSSGKKLFDVSALNSPLRSSLHHRMLAWLYQLSSEAEPTAFHRMLKQLDDEGRLLRVFSQNIDNLESRAGLTSGIPSTPPRTPSSTKRNRSSHLPPTLPSPASSSSPRTIPLHGLLTTLFCPLCPHTVPLSSLLPLLASGPASIPCPSCIEADEVRAVASLRSRGVGRMRASVVLYGEEHPRGEDIGRVVEADLKGKRREMGGEGRADLLIVVGTSLSIPGTKRLVQEFGKVVGGGKLPEVGVKGGGGGKGRLKGLERVKTVLLNLTPLAKPAETEGVFDVFVQGDVQEFVREWVEKAVAAPPTPVKKRKPKPESPAVASLPFVLEPPSPCACSPLASSSSNPYPTPTSSIPSPAACSSDPDPDSPATCSVEILSSSVLATPPKRDRLSERSKAWAGVVLEGSPSKKPRHWAIVGDAD